MKILGRILSILFALLLSLLVPLGSFVLLASELVSGTEVYSASAERIRTKQLEEISSLIDTLSQQYGFDADKVKADFSDTAFTAYTDEVRVFLQGLFQEQDEESERIYPYYMWPDGLTKICEDEGFTALVERTDQRIVAQDAIVSVLEKKAQNMVFPIRPQLVLAGVNMAESAVHLPYVVSLLDYWWVVPAAAVLLILLICLCSHQRMGWIGAALVAGCLSLASLLAFVSSLHIPQMAALVNPLFGSYLSGFLIVCLQHMAYIAVPALIIGTVLLICQNRRKKA